MNTYIETPPSTDPVMALVRGELSARRRWFYRGVLLAASVGVAVIVSLWTTEPRPLPVRLHVAFAGLAMIGVSWIGVLTWILLRRDCPTALDRIATGWVATGGWTWFIVMSMAIAVSRGRVGEVMWSGVVGVCLLVLALVMLWRAYAERARLRARLVELERGGN